MGLFKNVSIAALMLVLVAGSTMVARSDEKPVFQAGAAASNITPPLGQLIVGGWKPYPATNIHDELNARCLVLDDGKTRIAIVLCDNVGIPREVFDAARELIHTETNLPASHVLLASTHTHSATTARNANKLEKATHFTAYQSFLIRRITDGVRRAIQNLEPARIGWGQVDEPSEVFNRRWHLVPGTKVHLRNPFGGSDIVRMNPPRAHESLVKPAGPIDPQISFISVQSTTGRPIALLANYSLHYVGGTRRGDVSADYFGYFARKIQKLLGAEDLDPPFVGMLSNGTSGDINNINFRKKSPRRKPYEKMQQVANLVAERVYETHEKITFENWVPLGARLTDLTLNTRKPTKELIAYLEKIKQKPEETQTWHRTEKIYVRRIEAIMKSADEVAIPLQTIRIGDLGIATLPFEVFVETGLEIKEKSPFKTTFNIELANGSYGYLPTPAQHKLGGYETWLGTNYVETTATDKIVPRLLKMFSELKAESYSATD